MKISVIIPVYNDPEGLRDTLESLVDQDFDGAYEVLPVDNNSTDDTGEVIEEFENRYPELIRGLEENEVQSSYAARNKGVEEAEGDILVFLDADMWVDEDYLSSIKSFFDENEGIAYIGANVELVNDSSTVAGLYNEKKGFPIQHYIENLDFAPTCCLSVRREIFDEVGMFNDDLISGGDREFGIRCSEEGISMKYAENITAYHPVRSSWTSLKDKSFRIGRGKYQKQVICPDLFPEQRTPWYGLTEVMPTLPWKLKESTEGWENLSFKQKLGFYFIYWMKKVSSYLGYQYEKYLN